MHGDTRHMVAHRSVWSVIRIPLKDQLDNVLGNQDNCFYHSGICCNCGIRMWEREPGVSTWNLAQFHVRLEPTTAGIVETENESHLSCSAVTNLKVQFE